MAEFGEWLADTVSSVWGAAATVLLGISGVFAVVERHPLWRFVRRLRWWRDEQSTAPPPAVSQTQNVVVNVAPAAASPPAERPSELRSPRGDRPAALGDALFGRDGDLDRIDAAFEERRWVVVCGGAGLGKSQLAADWTASRGVGGYWTTAREDAPATVAALAPLLGVDETQSQELVVAAVQRRLAEVEPDAVWVVDNAAGAELCQQVRDAAPEGPRILFTTRDTRRGVLPANMGRVQIEVLGPADSVRLLRSRGYDGSADRLRELAEAVGHLPLALELLASLLGGGGWIVGALLREFENAPAAEFEVFKNDPRTEGPAPNVERSEGVYATLATAVGVLPRDVRERIAGLGYLGDAPIPAPLLAAVTSTEPDSVEWREMLDECQRLGLLRWGDGVARVHALTASAVRATNPGGSLETALERTGLRLDELRIAPPAFRVEEPHYRALLLAGRDPGRDGEVADDLRLTWEQRLGIAHLAAGDYESAITLGEEVLAARERILGEDDLETLISRNDLAESYHAAGRLGEAITLHERNLGVRERTLGDEHYATLISRGNLAGTYADSGRLDEAIALHARTLDARERTLGDEHPDTLTTRNNLAGSYYDAARLDEAIPLLERTLEARERTLGDEHPDTLTTRNNLAGSYYDAARLDEAIPLLERTLEARERTLGEEHPNTLTSRSNLAASYYAAGRLEEAIALRERTLEARERTLGEEHPDTLTSRNNLAESYYAVGRLEEAIALLDQTLDVRERTLGDEHPDTLVSRNNLAESYYAVGRLEEAIALQERTLEVRERTLGEEHPNTLISRGNLAAAYEAGGRTADAERLRGGRG